LTARFSTSVMPEGTEMPQHRLGDLEVGDHAVFHRADGHDVAGGAAQHALGLFADGQHIGGTGLDGDHRGFTQNNPLIPDVDEGVGCSEVDSDVVREETFDLR